MSFHMPLAIMVLSLILCILDGEINIFIPLSYVTIMDKNY